MMKAIPLIHDANIWPQCGKYDFQRVSEVHPELPRRPLSLGRGPVRAIGYQRHQGVRIGLSLASPNIRKIALFA
jgi:hypothetical protein